MLHTNVGTKTPVIFNLPFFIHINEVISIWLLLLDRKNVPTLRFSTKRTVPVFSFGLSCLKHTPFILYQFTETYYMWSNKLKALVYIETAQMWVILHGMFTIRNTGLGTGKWSSSPGPATRWLLAHHLIPGGLTISPIKWGKD